MEELSRILRRRPDGRLSFWCPGCQTDHVVSVGEHDTWEWNGSAEAPTFSPSVLVRQGHYAYAEPHEHCWCTYNRDHTDAPAPFKCYHCHSFVRDGNMHFLDDCSHELAGATVPIPNWPQKQD